MFPLQPLTGELREIIDASPRTIDCPLLWRYAATGQFANDLEIMDAVSRGEVSAGAVVNTYAGWYVHLQPDDGVKLVDGYTPEPDLRWNVALGLKNTDQALVDAVNAVLARRMADGTVRAIFAQYGSLYPPFEMQPTKKRAAAQSGASSASAPVPRASEDAEHAAR